MTDEHETDETSTRMESFGDKIAEMLRVAIRERAEDIQRAWNENIEEAHDNEKPMPPLRLSMGAVVDLEKQNIEVMLSFSAKYTSCINADLPDPNQPELFGDEAEGEMARSMERTLEGAGVKVERNKKL